MNESSFKTGFSRFFAKLQKWYQFPKKIQTCIVNLPIHLLLCCMFFFFQFCVVFDVQQIIFTKRKIEQEHTEKKSWKLWPNNIREKESNCFVNLLKLCAMITSKNLYLLCIVCTIPQDKDSCAINMPTQVCHNFNP